jgi:hypothetical protein
MRAFFIFGIGLGVLMGSSAFGQTVKCEKGDKLIMCPTEKVEENGKLKYADCKEYPRNDGKPQLCCAKECHPYRIPPKNPSDPVVCEYKCGPRLN